MPKACTRPKGSLNLGVDTIYVAAGIAPVEFFQRLLRREIVGRCHDPQLRSALDQIGQRLADGGEGLVFQAANPPSNGNATPVTNAAPGEQR